MASSRPNTFVYFVIIFTLTFFFTTTYALPFVVLHGISDKCTCKGVKSFTNKLKKWSGSEGYCVEIGNGVWDSWFMPLEEQTTIACKKIKSMAELKEGYNLVGLSQGNMVGRGVIEFCDGAPPVKNFISLAGPHAGIASIPFCGTGFWCILVDNLVKLAVYSSYVQEHLAPAGFIKIPTFEQDLVLVPKETSLFGYYPDGSWDTILSAQETKLYTEDWIGLKTLDEAGKVKFIKVEGGHLDISSSDIKKYIIPYVKNDDTSSRRVRFKLHHIY